MAFYWMTEAIPLPVTSLLPVVLFPLLDVESTGKICVAYLKETNMMFIGGLIVAIAVEHCKLHVRVALKVLLLIGTSPKRYVGQEGINRDVGADRFTWLQAAAGIHVDDNVLVDVDLEHGDDSDDDAYPDRRLGHSQVGKFPFN